MFVKHLTLLCLFSPALGSLLSGLCAKRLGVRGAHWVTILLMLIAFVSAAVLFEQVVVMGNTYTGVLYTWGVSGSIHFDVGFMVDALTVIMMLVVTLVSLLVHIYSVGYMAGDPGYQRFFCYMSLFTFFMLLLVSANNFFQLFVGWEGVGLVSYLLIGFWFEKDSAAVGSFKAFLVNRVSDLGFILAIAALVAYAGSVDYQSVFSKASALSSMKIGIFPGTHWSVVTVVCIFLFIGAMGKSAQMPLHIWLPASMEGPTPISALIHAATMVTAGVFMVARMSPLFELSSVALSVVLTVGATTALFTGLLAFVEFDLKRVIAFSTMSQLGYMMAANGVSAYSEAVFHLVTHAFFKALLFLAAGSVIVAMHHEQDMRKMGQLRKYLPVTYVTFLIGALALSAIPPFSGFYSKDMIIEAVSDSHIMGAGYAYVCLLMGAFVTAYYIFRAFFITFHTSERFPASQCQKIKESPWSMRVVLILLGVPSILLGAFVLIGFYVLKFASITAIVLGFKETVFETISLVMGLPFLLSVLGVFAAWLMVVAKPMLLEWFQHYFYWLFKLLKWQYGFDVLNRLIFVKGSQRLSRFFYKTGDLLVLEHYMVNGSGRSVTRIAETLRRFQSGYLYHYVLVMILSISILLIWFIFL